MWGFGRSADSSMLPIMSNPQRTAPPSGTIWIVFGFVFLAWFLIALIRVPFTLVGSDGASLLGGLAGLLVLAALSTWFLIVGFRKRHVRAIAAAPPTALPPAGWFPDASAPGQLRWWDGYRWTEHTTTTPTSQT